MKQRAVFLDRDGTLIEEPEDFQIDAYEKLRFVKDVIPAMLRLRDAGFEFVIVSLPASETLRSSVTPGNATSGNITQVLLPLTVKLPVKLKFAPGSGMVS